MFLAAFSAAAVLRPDTAAVAGGRDASPRPPPRPRRRRWRRSPRRRSRASPRCRRCTARARKPKHEAQEPRRRRRLATAPAPRRRRPRPPAATADPPPRADRTRPRRRTTRRRSAERRRQDLRHLRMIRGRRGRPSRGRACGGWPWASPWRWPPALGGWAVADRIAADPVAAPSDAEGPRRRPGAPEGLGRLGAGAPAAGAAGARQRARLHALPGPDDDRVGRARARGHRRRWCPPRWCDKANGGLPKAETAKRRRPAGARLPRRPDRRLGARHLRDPDHARRADLVCTARSGGREASPTWCLEGLDQITVDGARPITLNDATAYRMRAPRR